MILPCSRRWLVAADGWKEGWVQEGGGAWPGWAPTGWEFFPSHQMSHFDSTKQRENLGSWKFSYIFNMWDGREGKLFTENIGSLRKVVVVYGRYFLSWHLNRTIFFHYWMWFFFFADSFLKSWMVMKSTGWDGKKVTAFTGCLLRT